METRERDEEMTEEEKFKSHYVVWKQKAKR